MASSLQKCNKQQMKLHTEFDATSQAMEMITNAPSSREMEHRLSTLQTSLDMVERSIMRYENLIEDCRMQEEEEAHLEEEISCEQEEEEVTDTEMVDEEERCNPGPFGPEGRLILRTSLLWTLLKMLAPSSGPHWRCCLSRGGCLPHAAGIPTQRSSCWISQSQEQDRHSLRRDG